MPKIDNLRIFCSIYHPDIICIVESWLSTEISDSEISIQGYSVIRLDRNRHGGGVLIYVKSMFTYSLVFKGTADLELVVVSFLCSMHGTSPDITLALFYRPPNSSSFVIDTLFTVLCNLNVSVFSNFYLIGDFNIDFFVRHILSIVILYQLCLHLILLRLCLNPHALQIAQQRLSTSFLLPLPPR